MDLQLNGKTCLVTGASAGIGTAIARVLAREGTRLAILARRRDRLETIADESAAEMGARPVVIAADLMEPAGDPAKTIEHIAEEGGFDTIVIGSRGLSAVGRVLQGSVSERVATHTTATVVITH